MDEDSTVAVATNEAAIAFQGEMMLLRWSESSSGGRTVTFLLSEDEDHHPFREFSIKSGKRAGQRFMAVLVEIGDDERPENSNTKLSQKSYLLCRDETFWHWANERSFDNIENEESARHFVLSLCGVISRSQLDTNAVASRLFEEQILKPYLQYKAASESVLSRGHSEQAV